MTLYLQEELFSLDHFDIWDEDGNVKYQVQWSLTLLLGHKMRRLASGKARDIFSKFVTNPDLMCRNVVVDPTTDLNNTECSVRAAHSVLDSVRV